MKLRRDHGFSMLELLIVIGLIGGLVIVVLGYYRKADAGSQATRAVGDILALDAGIHDLAGHRADYTNITVDQLIDFKKAPAALVAPDGESLVNQWSGAITVQAVGTSQYAISYAAVPSDECNTITRTLEDAFTVIRVGGATGISGTAMKGLTPTERVAACAQDAGKPGIAFVGG